MIISFQNQTPSLESNISKMQTILHRRVSTEKEVPPLISDHVVESQHSAREQQEETGSFFAGILIWFAISIPVWALIFWAVFVR